MRVRRRAYWTPAPVRVSLDLFVGSHLPGGDDIGASTVSAVGALLSCRLSCSPYCEPMIGRTRASGAHDVASGPKLRKLRFQMIDDIPSGCAARSTRKIRNRGSAPRAVNMSAYAAVRSVSGASFNRDVSILLFCSKYGTRQELFEGHEARRSPARDHGGGFRDASNKKRPRTFVRKRRGFHLIPAIPSNIR